MPVPHFVRAVRSGRSRVLARCLAGAVRQLSFVVRSAQRPYVGFETACPDPVTGTLGCSLEASRSIQRSYSDIRDWKLHCTGEFELSSRRETNSRNFPAKLPRLLASCGRETPVSGRANGISHAESRMKKTADASRRLNRHKALSVVGSSAKSVLVNARGIQ